MGKRDLRRAGCRMGLKVKRGGVGGDLREGRGEVRTMRGPV